MGGAESRSMGCNPPPQTGPPSGIAAMTQWKLEIYGEGE